MVLVLNVCISDMSVVIMNNIACYVYITDIYVCMYVAYL